MQTDVFKQIDSDSHPGQSCAEMSRRDRVDVILKSATQECACRGLRKGIDSLAPLSMEIQGPEV
jgi:hypothetical protein